MRMSLRLKDTKPRFSLIADLGNVHFGPKPYDSKHTELALTAPPPVNRIQACCTDPRIEIAATSIEMVKVVAQIVVGRRNRCNERSRWKSIDRRNLFQ